MQVSSQHLGCEVIQRTRDDLSMWVLLLEILPEACDLLGSGRSRVVNRVQEHKSDVVACRACDATLAAVLDDAGLERL